MPRCCVLCGARAAGSELCAGCLEDLPWLAHCCPSCAIPLPSNERCSACQPRTASTGNMLAALAYEYPVDRLVVALKYQQQQALAPLLGELLAIRVLTTNLEVPECAQVVPVPLHPGRYRQRGFNQAELIATAACQKLVSECIGESGLTLNHDCLQRARPTRSPPSPWTRRTRISTDGSRP